MLKNEVVQLKSYDETTGQEIGNVLPITNSEAVKVTNNKKLTEILTELNDKIELANATLDNTARIDCVWVETWGNDNTGKVNKMNKPVATLDKALDLLPNGGNIYIGRGRFRSPSFNGMEQYSKIGNNHNFFGSGMPVWRKDKTGMLDGSGTILEGSFVMINTNNNICKDFGVDVGSEVCNRLFGGVAKEGFVTVTVWAQPNVYKTPNKGKVFHNISSICMNENAMVHAFLCEAVDEAVVDNIKTCYGTHGIVFKAINTNAINLYAEDNWSNPIIIKANTYADCLNCNFVNLLCKSDNYYGTGVVITADDGKELKNINISNCIVYSTNKGLSISGNVHNCNIDITFDNVNAKGFEILDNAVHSNNIKINQCNIREAFLGSSSGVNNVFDFVNGNGFISAHNILLNSNEILNIHSTTYNNEIDKLIAKSNANSYLNNISKEPININTFFTSYFIRIDKTFRDIKLRGYLLNHSGIDNNTLLFNLGFTMTGRDLFFPIITDTSECGILKIQASTGDVYYEKTYGIGTEKPQSIYLDGVSFNLC